MDLETLSTLLVSQVLPVVTVLVVVLLVSRFAFGAVARTVHGYSFAQESVERDNPAVLIRLAGLLFATVTAFMSVVKPSGLGFVHDMAIIGETMLMVLAALWISLWVNDKCILHELSNTHEVVSERNAAVATVEAATTVATALIFSGAFAGSDDKFATEVIWFAVGQMMLVALAFSYRMFIPSIAEHLAKQNMAVALSMSGLLLAGGMALGSAIAGPSTGWESDIASIALYMGVWLIVMVSLRLVVNFVIIPGARMRREITVDRNWGVGLVDSALSVAITAVYINLFG